MRSFADVRFRVLVAGAAFAALGGCGIIGGGDRPERVAAAPDAFGERTGPAADYPMVLGAPFTVEGELYTPADTLNYDAVGYVAADEAPGVTAAHRTLPLPSYAELTSLETGKTILVRIERRGPMVGKSLVALAPAALAQLGAGEGTPVRVRRVNPPEAHRAELRAGRAAAERMETPRGLVEVLRRKLPASGAAPVRTAIAAPVSANKAAPATRQELPVVAQVQAQATPQAAMKAYPLPPLQVGASGALPATVVHMPTAPASYRLPAVQPATPPAPAPTVAQPAVGPREKTPAAPVGAFVVQAGSFASESNARRAAQALGGFVKLAGKLYRVRTGPFASRGQAEAALAKVRAAGYSDARVTTSS